MCINCVCNELLAFLYVSSQSMVGTRSGLFGLSVVVLVVQESNSVIVPAQILRQHTEDDGATALDHGQNHGLVTFSGAQQVSLLRSRVF